MARVGKSWVCAAVMALAMAVSFCGSVQGQSDEADALNRRVLELYRAGKAGEAILLAKRALQMREKTLPAGHPDIAQSLNNLAVLYRAQGRLSEAEPLYKRALEMREKALPAGHADIAISLNNLALFYQAQGRLGEAEPLLERALAIFEKALPAGHPDIAQSLNNLAELYRAQGRLSEAEPLYKRALEMREKALPAGHPDIAASLNNLALFYQARSRLGEAEPLFKRALAIFEKALPAGHPHIALGLDNLAGLYQAQGRLGEAEPLAKRALAVREKALPARHPDIAASLNSLAFLYQAQGRLGEAEPLYKRALEMREKTLPAGHPDIAQSLNNLAVLYRAQGRLGEAEPLYKRALEMREKALPAGHADIAISLNNLAFLYQAQGRLGEAEPLFKRALAIFEKALPAGHPDIAQSLNNLAVLFDTQGRLGEAELLHKRALEMREKGLPAGHPDIAASLNNLALLYHLQGRLGEAEPLYKRALEIVEEALPAAHPDTATSLNNLAGLYVAQSRLGEAELLYKRALAMKEKALPAGHPNIALSLNNLAELYRAQGRLGEAEPLYKRALAMKEKALPAGHPNIALSLGTLSLVYFAHRDWPTALSYQRRATAILIKRETAPGTGTRDSGSGEVERNAGYFSFHVLAAHRAGASDAALRAEAFEMSQWAQRTEAAAALAQMAVRQAKGDSELARRSRERQDLERQRQAADRQLSGALGGADAALADWLRRDMTALDARLAAIDVELVQRFPEYVALANPKPLSIAATQAVLGDDEALLQLLNTPALPGLPPAQSFAWLITKTDARWVKLDLAPKAINELVAALRCGLDATAWRGAGEARCQKQLGVTFTSADAADGMPLPFDLTRAHDLYRTLLGPFADLIKGKHLLVVPSGSLTSLPFSVLVTEPPDKAVQSSIDGHRTVAWLGLRQPISVLPSVSSLEALRKHGKSGTAPEAFIGFGDPVLEGTPPECPIITVPAACPDVPVASNRNRAKEASVRLAGAAIMSVTQLFRGGLADVAAVRKLCPLPDTAHELMCVARSLGVGKSQVYLAEAMTETALKTLPLDRYRIVHFATHGLLAGESEKIAKVGAEPALVLTPPETASEADDGLLTSSEITELKLNADWVVLSACNTAAGGATGTEALSGLARAFFYAGARALLVSHWEVYSNAAVKLTTTAFAEMKANAAAGTPIGRAEALRRSMGALIAKGKVHETHPAYWAPFVVVGEGGTAQKTVAPSSEAAVSASIPSANAGAEKVVPPNVAAGQAMPPLSSRPAAGRPKKAKRPTDADRTPEQGWDTRIFSSPR